MRVLLLGGTGSIGTAITRELVHHGHTVTGLARSDQSAARLAEIGASPLRGDLKDPQRWSDRVHHVDAVIQAAATFEADMGETDRKVITELLNQAARRDTPLRFLYTGGCWLYGATGERIADETTFKRPISSFEWMIAQARQVLTAKGVSAAVLHPAMVYHEDGGGVFSRYLDAARREDPIEAWGGLGTRWPLVHRDDLARAYRSLLERPDLTGEFNVCAQSGVPAHEIISEITRRRDHASGYVVRTLKYVLCKYGDWAEGPTLDQQLCAEKLKLSCGWEPEHRCFSQAAF
ncbi:NAD-dependent epimerase/dehydratase family protein [Phaeobacter sp. QD34_3]|uniref:NAD-dependent epimerase/dehydratase family protein n=1 Tax=unclassified Phaeobacter TaxID=2621772 RepID=UPI00237FC5C5|nr:MULTISPECIES: NAD-dependent epimerase/dehydratase family protein [unclassified Phaeobacter]MDE4132001.1 NAD-dependent epimerase/dehydratase family protein [Phaeobacter sp. QD34_3]MDE4135639.1 NAD-dependent epimerase/dehydratase family protein [Phaeobacter sp. QD34_24]